MRRRIVILEKSRICEIVSKQSTIFDSLNGLRYNRYNSLMRRGMVCPSGKERLLGLSFLLYELLYIRHILPIVLIR